MVVSKTGLHLQDFKCGTGWNDSIQWISILFEVCVSNTSASKPGRCRHERMKKGIWSTNSTQLKKNSWKTSGCIFSCPLQSLVHYGNCGKHNPLSISLLCVFQDVLLFKHTWSSCNIPSSFIVHCWRTSVYLQREITFGTPMQWCENIPPSWSYQFAAGNYCSAYVRKFLSSGMCT